LTIDYKLILLTLYVIYEIVMDVRNLIGETTEYDKKRALEVNRPKSWCKSVSAFANGNGGILIFGISDDNCIVGLVNPDYDAMKISEIIKSRLDPIPEFQLDFENVDGKILIILKIYPGEETPYYYSANGVLETYVRIGNESVKATAMEQKRLVMRGKNSSYDTQISSYKISDYAFTKLRERYKKWTGKSFEDKDMISFGLSTEEGFLSNAGALLADECPIRWSRLFCTRWNGLNKSGGKLDAIDDTEYSGSLISLLENGVGFIKRNAKKMWRKTSNSREEMPEYVERSYHEAIINALVHRDYIQYGSEVHIDIYNDRMEIHSPGGMADGINIQDRDPLSVPSTRRNPLLADVFERLGYMERKGSGFWKIINAYELQVNYEENKKPSFFSDRANFVVIMPNLNYATQGVAQDVPQSYSDLIISIIRENNQVTRKQIAEKIGVSKKTIEREIEKMSNIKYIGSGYSGFWKIIEKGNQTLSSNKNNYLHTMPKSNSNTQDVAQDDAQGVAQGVAQDVPQGVPQDVPQDVPQSYSDMIISIIRENNQVTRKQIAEKIGVSKKTIEREIKKMSNIKYIGSGYSGFWKICE